jgi:asparagine synthase (glutamine-hydrolysing)
MCGIVAIVARQGESIDPADVTRATAALAHRGPDDQTQWFNSQQTAALGHTRLSVIDLSGGVQPIANEDGSIHIVANGEFYDFENIRAELEKRGHRFRTHSDSEIALHLYEERGPACLEELRGEFAFVIWDDSKRTLFAARDRFGIKPLFYFISDHRLYVASEVQALFSAGVACAWDDEAVYKTLFFCNDQTQTLFKGVRQAPPGHYLLSTPASLRLVRYWDLDYPRAGEPPSQRSQGELTERLRFHLNEAVRLRMRADVPVGCYLSGGIDSASVLALASQHSPKPVTAFTVAFSDREFDESPAAKRHADFIGAQFHRIEVSEMDVARSFTSVVGHGEMLHYNAHGVARWLLSRAVQQAGYKVVLAGEGADELFFGYDFLTPALASSMNPSRLISWTRLLRLLRRRTSPELAIAKTSPWLSRMCRFVAAPQPVLESLAEKLTILRAALAPKFVDEAGAGDIYADFVRKLDVRKTLKGREPAKQLLYLWTKSMFVNYVLAGERLDMAHAIEVRLPFLDHKLFEFARSIPTALHSRNGTRKYLLRETVKDRVSDEVYRRNKQPFLAPAATLRTGSPLYQMLHDVLRSEAFLSMPFIDSKSVTRMLDRLPSLTDDYRSSVDPVIFAFASLAVIRKRYKL